MNKIFTIFLLLILSFGIISCGSSDDPVSQALDQPNSTDDENNTSLPVITGSCYLLDNSTHDNSTIDNSSISDNSTVEDSTITISKIIGSTVEDSTITISKIIGSTVDNASTIDNSTISGVTDRSDVDSSYVCSSNVDNSTIDNSTICLSIIDNSTIRKSTVDNYTTIENSTIDNSTIDNSTINNSNFDNSTTSRGTNFDNVTGDNITCVNCDLDDLICNGCILDNATVCNATLDNVTLTNVSACESGVVLDLDNKTLSDQTVSETDAPYTISMGTHSYAGGTNTYTTSVTVSPWHNRDDNISVTFNESIDTTTVTTNTDNDSCYGTFQLSLCPLDDCDNAFGECIIMSGTSPFPVLVSNDNKTFTIDPSPRLAIDNAIYKIKVTTDVKDPSGNALNDGTLDNESTFTTTKT